ncbi:MAG: sugar transferase [Clostridiales bacterium]|nr:sugar transferase [Clostridiales bacterium]
MNETREGWELPLVPAVPAQTARQGYGGLPKRLFDIIVASILLILVAIPMLLAALATKLEGGGCVIFRQVRVGVGMRPFVCYKFRTMKPDAPPDRASAALEHPERYITRVGAALRRFSVDELPQLFNVLLGDMSLVGPRPVIPGETGLVELRRRLGVYSVKPGITGLAQVHGRDCISVSRKAELDAEYVRRMSLWLDIALLCRTFFCVIFCRDVHEGK